MTCRELPVGLNVGGAFLEGNTTVVAAEELRFSKPEIAKFFEFGLSGRELAAVTAHTAGWPFAVRITRNKRECTAPEGTSTLQNFVENWMESRLFEGLGATNETFCSISGCSSGWMRNFSTRHCSVPTPCAESTRFLH